MHDLFYLLRNNCCPNVLDISGFVTYAEIIVSNKDFDNPPKESQIHKQTLSDALQKVAED